MRLCADADVSTFGQRVCMGRRSYAVWWQRSDGRRCAGKLELAGLHMLISGNERIALPLDEITVAEYRRGELRVHCRGCDTLRIGSLDAAGGLLELSDSPRLKIRAA